MPSHQQPVVPRPPLRLGLTGGIGSGKSTVAGMLRALGATVVDTDAISRALTAAGGAAIPVLREAFGAAFIDDAGALDRARMRALVFSDASARGRLEAILHPLIRTETQRQAQVGHAPMVVFDVPLLVESARWRDQVDRVCVVDCSEATQVRRVIARSGWTDDSVRAVIEGQATRQARRAAADAVIHNDGLSWPDLQAETAVLWRWCLNAC